MPVPAIKRTAFRYAGGDGYLISLPASSATPVLTLLTKRCQTDNYGRGAAAARPRSRLFSEYGRFVDPVQLSLCWRTASKWGQVHFHGLALRLRATIKKGTCLRLAIIDRCCHFNAAGAGAIINGSTGAVSHAGAKRSDDNTGPD
jgi:hypothetical protein